MLRSGSISIGLIAAFVLALQLGVAWHNPARAGNDRWTSTGPFGGQVTTLAVDPQTPSTLYAAALGGIFNSTDGGASWARASSGITDLSIKALVIDPQTPTTLYAGTDQGGGVFKSTDGGISWTALNSAAGVVNGLAIDPKTPTTLYAAEEQSGLLKSTDGGATFNGIGGSGLPGFGTYVALAIDPNTTTTLYASEQTNGIFRSTDGGNSWAAANTGLTGGSLINAQALVINPQNTSTLYAAVDTGNGKLAIYGSTNGAGSWTLLSTLGTDNGNGSLVLNPQTPSTLYAGGYGLGVLQSTSGGASFAPVVSGLTNDNVLALAINPQSPATLYAGTQAGVFATVNAGSAWAVANTGLALAKIVSVVVDANTPTTLYAATGVSGASLIYKSTDGGETWTPSNTGITPSTSTAELTVLAIDPVTSTTLYAGGEAGFGLFKSTNGGASWTETDSGLPQRGFTLFTDLAIDPQTTSTLYAGTQDAGVFKSTDGGATWTAVDNGLTGGAGENIVNLSIAGAPTTALFASTVADGPFVSVDGAGSWSQLDFTLSSQNSADPRRKAISPRVNPGQFPPCLDTFNKITAFSIKNGAYNGDLIQTYYDCYFNTSSENQQKLVKILNGLSFLFNQSGAGGSDHIASTAISLPATPWGQTDGAYATNCQPLAAIVINPLDSTNFYAGGGCGVLIGTNSGQQVVSMSLGLPASLQVNALAITPTASDLYAGTLGGVYRYSFVDSPLAAAVLPSSRSVETGVAATAFATLVNGGTTAATGCSLAPSTSLPAGFFYQTTVPGTNALTGAPNTPVDIAGGSYQTFIFGLTPQAAIAPIDVQFDFSCSGVAPAAVLPGIDTLLLSGSTTPVPDIVALAGTPSADGILDLPGTSGANAFVVATLDLGAADTITATAAATNATLPIAIAICQTDPSSGQCLAPAGASVSTMIAAGATPTFAIFVGGAGTVPFDPAANRIDVQFTGSDGNVHGSTSVAVRTQ